MKLRVYFEPLFFAKNDVSISSSIVALSLTFVLTGLEFDSWRGSAVVGDCESALMVLGIADISAS